MVLQILLIISIILQIVAAAIAVRLMTRTKYNFSWILFTVALTAMVAIRCAEYAQVVWDRQFNVPQYFFVWMGVLTSLCFAVGIFYVQKIFNWIDRINHQQRISEKRILNTVLRTEEKERLRFSKELHDGLGPLLSSAKMSLSALDRTGMGDDKKELLDNTNYVIEEAIRSLREISNNLSPHILNDFGLGRGVANFINKLPAKGDIRIDYDTNLRGERFDTDVEVILYRVICELINNSIKHSGGSGIRLSLWYRDDTLGLDYSDNGRGFNHAAMADVGMGLSNISSRISSLKGTCDIRSDKGSGMAAEIRINLRDYDGRKGTNK
ncbi:MAG: histidine kinase [Alistipes sp.]|nr:histidine kinase [Alistipes sp.]